MMDFSQARHIIVTLFRFLVLSSGVVSDELSEQSCHNVAMVDLSVCTLRWKMLSC